MHYHTYCVTCLSEAARVMMEVEKQHGAYIPRGKAWNTQELAQREMELFATPGHVDTIESCDNPICRVHFTRY